jgi:predicted  nucleic acid-binding Zn-ribbon protein|tara:strand:+ start:1716 stop:1901 length:186 start_codon:yes stop_codon:yes gene_type:complete
MAVNEEYQMQAAQFKDREIQYNELAREYRDKLESVKFERERIALKEEQFLRQVQKAESQSK